MYTKLKKNKVSLQLNRHSCLRERMWFIKAGVPLAASFVYDLVQMVNTSSAVSYSNIIKGECAEHERLLSNLKIKTNKQTNKYISHLSVLTHSGLSKMNTGTLYPKSAADLWMETTNWDVDFKVHLYHFPCNRLLRRKVSKTQRRTVKRNLSWSGYVWGRHHPLMLAQVPVWPDVLKSKWEMAPKLVENVRAKILWDSKFNPDEQV